VDDGDGGDDERHEEQKVLKQGQAEAGQ